MRLLATHVVSSGDDEKYIRLYHGDLAAIPPDERVDLLVVSAFPNDYTPTPTSLIGALQRKGVSVLALSTDKAADLRGAFSCWLSKDLSAQFPSAGFRRILCFEATGGHATRDRRPHLSGHHAFSPGGAADSEHRPARRRRRESSVRSCTHAPGIVRRRRAMARARAPGAHDQARGVSTGPD